MSHPSDLVAAKPVIGVTCYVEPVDRAPWRGQRSAVLPMEYVDHLTRAGAVAVLLPPPGATDTARLDAEVAAVLARLDGLVVAGGADVSADRYGAPPHPASQAARPDRDAWELALVRAARTAGLPLLGVCRGMQLMAVEAGGTLHQHLPDVVRSDVHCPEPGAFTRHTVDVLAGTQLATILGDGPLDVPTYHHQAVASHPGYRVAAGHGDGTVEAIEPLTRGDRTADEATGSAAGTGTFCIGVQWHPEAGEDLRLFAALVRSATRPRSKS